MNIHKRLFIDAIDQLLFIPARLTITRVELGNKQMSHKHVLRPDRGQKTKCINIEGFYAIRPNV